LEPNLSRTDYGFRFEFKNLARLACQPLCSTLARDVTTATYHSLPRRLLLPLHPPLAEKAPTRATLKCCDTDQIATVLHAMPLSCRCRSTNTGLLCQHARTYMQTGPSTQAPRQPPFTLHCLTSFSYFHEHTSSALSPALPHHKGQW
jgi:hypothetical protein